jgi:hypothetical protein
MSFTRTPDSFNLLPIHIVNDLKSWFGAVKDALGHLKKSTGDTIARLDDCWILNMKGRKQYSKVDDAILQELRDALESVYREKRDDYERLPKRLEDVEELMPMKVEVLRLKQVEISRPKEVEELRPRKVIANETVNEIQGVVTNEGGKDKHGLIGAGASEDSESTKGDDGQGQITGGEDEYRNSEDGNTGSDEDGYVYDNDQSLTDGSELGEAISTAYLQIPTSEERSLVPVWYYYHR